MNPTSGTGANMERKKEDDRAQLVAMMGMCLQQQAALLRQQTENKDEILQQQAKDKAEILQRVEGLQKQTAEDMKAISQRLDSFEQRAE